MQWHKRILRDFSLGLEDRTASSYQGCLSGSGLVISYPKDSDDREGKKKEKYSNRHPSTFMGGLP